ncbi:MAG: hypothetical protein ACRDZ3_10135 [Acidimicrobiia bacterium]
MPLALLLIALVLLVPVAKLGSKGDAGTVAAALITVLLTVGAASSLA